MQVNLELSNKIAFILSKTDFIKYDENIPSNLQRSVTTSEGIKLYYKNPSKSRASVIIELVIIQNDKEYVIAKSDLLPPGYTLYSMKLDTSLNLENGGYKGMFKVTIYDEETGAKQIVNSKIEVSIEVK